ncbi:MAG: hypothetical protein HOB84_09730 [Candidatus Marinimicrobia bacterium]|jgi:hypothetical protein|nr:hypothetical protein [Candidatus Neomarinimicrobiota bacterium]MBT4360681.1 hypothetical protein [Candidatus Neomarinimicrobiota bacterium]MBT4715040.1 hypothetical protein [Candidatus Neomarinimicrobiota bacterium]MBT4944579.1 hypothetical protein [Candidatus Neomarinimicrobiota bacterium]MBT5271383.1 hypothetical protein [Candidatus Neomarinimicrobiota bacterium]
MMKQSRLLTKYFTLFVLVGYCLGLSSVFLPLIEYAVDYRRIVAEKCENVAKPELECNGKCYLSKQIVKQAVPETTEAGANIVVLNLGIDPHFSTEAKAPLNFKYSELFLTQNILFTNIILEKSGQPPEC